MRLTPTFPPSCNIPPNVVTVALHTAPLTFKAGGRVWVRIFLGAPRLERIWQGPLEALVSRYKVNVSGVQQMLHAQLKCLKCYGWAVPSAPPPPHPPTVGALNLASWLKFRAAIL